MLVVRNMCIQYGHLTTTDTCTHITHAIVESDGRVLIIWIRIACLCGQPHNLVSLFCIAANQSATATGGNHLVTIKRKHTILTEGSKYLTIKARTHTFGSILHHRDAIFVGDSHNLIYLIRHTIECYRHDSLRIFSSFLFTVKDCFLQQFRIHIPCIFL